MKSLELVAAKKFNEFAAQQNSHAVWAHLSRKRQLAWIIEVGDNIIHGIEQVEAALDLQILKSKPSASFDQGFIAGQEYEHKRMKSKLTELKNSVMVQVERFENANCKN